MAFFLYCAFFYRIKKSILETERHSFHSVPKIKSNYLTFFIFWVHNRPEKNNMIKSKLLCFYLLSLILIITSHHILFLKDRSVKQTDQDAQSKVSTSFHSISLLPFFVYIFSLQKI